MRTHRRAAELRRQIAYLTALLGADEALTPQSKRLQAWRSELETQGYEAHDIPEMLRIENKWFTATERAPDELLEGLKSELPEAEQREEEERIELARLATGEPSWGIPMALAWIRFRDVEQACRFLERRDALMSLWRDGLETNELERQLSSGVLRCTGARDGDRREINPADWAREGREGLRLMRDSEPYAARPGEKASYTQLRLQRQAVQSAFPTPGKPADSHAPFLAAARNYLAHGEGRVGWDLLWTHVAEKLGVSVSKRRKEKLEPKLREEFPHRFGRGRLKRK